MAYHLQKRRRAQRAPLNRPVEMSVGRGKMIARGIEVGTGGMSVWCEKQLQIGEMVTVSFSLPASAIQLTAMARVVWQKPAPAGQAWWRIGLQFVVLPREERQLLRSFILKLARNYRDLHILLSMNKWKLEQLQELARKAHLSSFRDVQDLKRKVAKAMDGFRA